MSKIRLFGTSSGYVEIAPAAAASNNTLTAPSTVGEIIAKDAAGAIGITSMKASNVNVGAAVTITESGIEASGIGITCANINGAQIAGRRNIIINGAMNIAQRGTSIAITGSTNTYIADRFFTENFHDGAWTFTQSSTVPDNKFRNSLKVDVTTADTSMAASQYCQIQQRIEAQNLHAVENFRQPMTFSFWVRSNKTGNYSFTLQQNDNSNRQMPGQYTINAANTWEKKIITVPADSSGLVNDDNGIGLILTWGLAYGSNYTSGSVATNNAFKAYSGGDFGVGQDVNLLDSTSNEWYLTGVQLEVGSQATPFEHLSFGEELKLCERYCETILQGESNGAYMNNTVAYANNAMYTIVRFRTPKRASDPTLVQTSGTDYYTLYRASGSTTAPSFTGVSWPNTHGGALYNSMTCTEGQAGLLGSSNTGALLLFTSEL